MGNPNLLAFLNPEQLAAVEHRGTPLLVLAGAGSGKTRVVTVRIANLVARKEARPGEIVAITFTNKAAAEMRSRINDLIGVDDNTTTASRVWIHTFHALCARILRREIHNFPNWDRNFVIATQSDQRAIIGRLCGPSGQPGSMDASKVIRSIEKAKHNLIGPAAFPAITPVEKRIKDIYHYYQEELAESGALDYSDLIMMTAQLFHEYPEVLEKYQRRFRHVMVDEYQDTNTAQHDLVRLLAGDAKNLCVVGDPDQSIYGWRGAEPENLLRFTNDYPSGKIITLLQNYRSTRNILTAANELISNNPRPLGLAKELWTKGEEGAKISVYSAPDEYDEGGWIAGEIFRSVNSQGASYADFAILYRTNAQSRTLEDALRKRSIPYTIIAGTRFYDRREIRDLLSYLRLLINPGDLLSFRRIINVPSRGVGKISVERVMTEIESHPEEALFDSVYRCVVEELIPPRARRAVERLMILLDELINIALPVDKLVEELLERIDYTAWLQKSNDAVARLENVEEFRETAKDFTANNPDGSLEEFLEEVSLAAPIDDFDELAGSVSLLTLHAAKGLEFPNVFISGVEEGLLPLTRNGAESEEGIEEERRLCYVGITRAEYRLHLSRSVRRNIQGRKVWSKASRFIKELPVNLIDDHSTGNLNILSTSEDLLAVEKERAEKRVQKQGVVFTVGDRVWHDKWGRGIILSRAGGGPSLKLTVKFTRHGIKKLVAKYANLQKM